MTHPETPEQAAIRALDALATGKSIPYATAMPDNLHAEIQWSILGLPETNKIAVVAEIGELRLGRAAPSTLLFSSMHDRIFGLDVSDRNLAVRLSEELGAAHSDHLIAAELRRRGH